MFVTRLEKRQPESELISVNPISTVGTERVRMNFLLDRVGPDHRAILNRPSEAPNADYYFENQLFPPHAPADKLHLIHRGPRLQGGKAERLVRITWREPQGTKSTVSR